MATEHGKKGQEGMRSLVRVSLVGLVAAVLLLAFAGAVGAASPPSHYPLDLSTAVGNAYRGKLTGIQRMCTLWLNNGRDEYALAQVTLRGGRSDTGGFQFINTAGWFNMWRSHAPTAVVPAGQRATVTKLVRQVASTCGGRWTP